MHKKIAKRNAEVYLEKLEFDKKEAADWMRRHVKKNMSAEEILQVKEAVSHIM